MDTVVKKRRRSTSERSGAARMARAAEFVTLTEAFEQAYQPSMQDLSAAALLVLIEEADAATTAAVVARVQAYTACTERRKLFGKPHDGLSGRLSGIRTTLVSTFGKASPQIQSIDPLLAQIRGKVKKGSGGDGVSQSQQSFAGKTSALLSIIALLQKFGSDYAPANPLVTLASLEALQESIDTANANVAATALVAAQAAEVRKAKMAVLSERIQRAKAAVASQYGVDSVQAASVRKLLV